MSDYISKQQVVNLREFLNNYYGMNCHWKGKMTHKRMLEFLKERGKHANRGICGEITDEQKLNGEFIYVMDEIGKIIPYKRPDISLDHLHVNLVKNTNKQKLEEIRLQILNSQGLTYDDYGRVITIEEAEQKKMIEQQIKEEEQKGRILDMEEAYYEKMSYSNRLVKIKRDYRYRRAL